MTKKCIPILLTFMMLLALHSPVFSNGDNGLFAKSIISIYPNPVVYEANITLEKEINLEENEVSLYFYNIVGEEVHLLENIEDHQFRVNKDSFKKSGIYLFQLRVNGEIVKTGKINIH